MRKLAIAAGGFSAAVFAANYILPLSWLPPCAVLLALLAGGLLFLRRRWLRGLILNLFGLALGLGCFALHAQFTVLPARELDGQELPVTAVVLTNPQAGEDYVRAELRLKAEGAPALRTVLYDRGGTLISARPGDRIAGTVKLSAADTRYGERYDAYNARDIYLLANTKDPLELQQAPRFSLTGLPARLNARLSLRIAEFFPADTAPYFQALLLGNKADFYADDGLYIAMSRAGFLHIVAVSGMHVAFLVSLIQLLLGKNRHSSLLCLALVWAFVLLTGGSASAVRAGFMQSTLLLAPLLRRENDPPTSLLTALALLLAANPRAAASVGLQLSFCAMAGILLFAEPLQQLFYVRASRPWLRRVLYYLSGIAASSVAVLILSAPLMGLYFGYVSILSPLGNVLSLWTVPLCFGGGFAACLLGAVFAPLGQALAWLLSWPARFLFLTARLLSGVSFSAVYLQNRLNILWLLLCYALYTIAALSRSSRRFKLLFPTALCALGLCFSLTAARLHYQGGTGYFTVLDVGQGQCLCAFSGQNTLVIDCGAINSRSNAGEVCGNYLKSCGRKQIDLLMLTHLHADHANGVCRLLEQLPVETILLPAGLEDEDEQLPGILASAERHGCRIVTVDKDINLSAGGIGLSLYAPLQAGDMNERCLTGLVSLGDFDALITGDIDKAGELALAESHEFGQVELLVVGHHGSRYSSTGPFLEAVGADTAVISVGYNSFGHPTGEVLERLAAYGYRIYRTDLNGTVEFRVP